MVKCFRTVSDVKQVLKQTDRITLYVGQYVLGVGLPRTFLCWYLLHMNANIMFDSHYVEHLGIPKEKGFKVNVEEVFRSL